MTTLRIAMLAAALCVAPCPAQQNFLSNSGFENGFNGWSTFGPVAAQAALPPQYVPRTGGGMASLAGNGGGFNVSGIFQTFPANRGDQFTIDAYSRHWGGTPMTGTGAPNGNWMIMKMAFFNASMVEIGGAEGTILDGNSPTDVWIDNPPVIGIAPPGTVTVQAFILFLQPAAGLGEGQVDDIYFTGPANIAPYPGTGEDLLLTTGVGGGGTSGGTGSYVKLAGGGALVECNVASPGGTYRLRPYFLLAQPFGTGAPPQPVLPAVWFNLTQPLFILVDGAATGLFGASVIGPLQGTSTFFGAPAGLSGTSLMLQALVVDSNASNGIFAASDGYEIQFN